MANSEMGPQKFEKSPEELRYEDLLNDLRDRQLEPDYTFTETEEDEENERQISMRGANWESGDPEKMAMFRLQEAKLRLEALVAKFYVLESLEKSKKDRISAIESLIEKDIARLKPVLKVMVLSMPENLEEAEALRKELITFNNWRALADLFKVQGKSALE